MSTFGTLWVMSEDPQSFAALCAVGRRLAERVEAVWIGSEQAASSVAVQGVDVVHVAVSQEGELFEDCVGAVAQCAAEQHPDAILLSTSKRMRLAAARLAAELGTRVVNDATQVDLEGDALQAEHMVYGGSAFGTERMQRGAAVVLLSEGMLLSESVPAPESEPSCSAAPIEMLSVDAPPSGFALVERRARTVEAVNLAAAKRVVSAGRGIAEKEDLQLVEQLADAIEAEVGCTRPLAEGVNWLARERYIGVSGVMLKPELFVTVGVSGQVQHMVGANRAKTIVAINKDKNAPVFKQADYGIVGDLYEVVPQLIAELKA